MAHATRTQPQTQTIMATTKQAAKKSTKLKGGAAVKAATKAPKGTILKDDSDEVFPPQEPIEDTLPKGDEDMPKTEEDAPKEEPKKDEGVTVTIHEGKLPSAGGGGKKLSYEKAQQIRAEFNAGKKQGALAKEHGVDPWTIRAILVGYTYKVKEGDKNPIPRAKMEELLKHNLPNAWKANGIPGWVLDSAS